MDKKQETSNSQEMNEVRKPKRTFAQACKECKAVSLDEFCAEWMRRLENRFKHGKHNS